MGETELPQVQPACLLHDFHSVLPRVSLVFIAKKSLDSINALHDSSWSPIVSDDDHNFFDDDDDDDVMIGWPCVYVANQSNSGLHHSSTLGAWVCRTG